MTTTCEAAESLFKLMPIAGIISTIKIWLLRTLYACFNSLHGPVPSVDCHAHIHGDKAKGSYKKDAHCIPCRHSIIIIIGFTLQLLSSFLHFSNNEIKQKEAHRTTIHCSKSSLCWILLIPCMSLSTQLVAVRQSTKVS